MKQIQIMIKPASSLCNLRCGYCFYHETAGNRLVPSYGIMTEEIRDGILGTLSQALGPGDRLALSFQGGEPCMAGLSWFQDFTAVVRRMLPGVQLQYAFQTNGTLLTEEWCRFLHEEKVLTGISLDLPQDSHEYARVDADGKGTYKRVVQAISLLRKHRVDFNVLCTLTNPAARHPEKVYQAIRALDLKYVQFTPCLDSGETEGKDPFCLTPERFASFYRGIFPLWLKDLKAGHYISIKLFDDLVRLLAFGEINACGLTGFCAPQLVIEADGSAYPCDFYCTDAYRLGNLAEEQLDELLSRSLSSPQKQKAPLPAGCGTCPYLKLCGGGCKRMQRQVFFGKDPDFCGYRQFLTTAMPELLMLAREERHSGR